MLRKFMLIAGFVMLALGGCSNSNKTSMLDDISGVWKANSENALMTIAYSDKKVRVLFDDVFIPVIVGEIDEENRTVNFNVKLKDGTSAVWTIKQIWDNKEKTSFHLGLTLHTGTQDEFSFVRKISTDDLNRIANLEPRPQAQPISGGAKDAIIPRTESIPLSNPATETQVQPTKVAEVLPKEPLQQIERAPQSGGVAAVGAVPDIIASFDCSKASSKIEKLICSSAGSADADSQLAVTYRAAVSRSNDKATLKQAQRDWLSQVRNACTDTECLTRVTEARTHALSVAQ